MVDNGSADGTARLVRQFLPQAQVMALPGNLGFGAANNRALARCETPYALLVNPDCAITAEAATELVETADAFPDAAIVAPQLLNRAGQEQLNYGFPRLRHSSTGPAAAGPVCVGNACGAVMLLRMAAQPSRQWFDERFFLYYEDEDLCLRQWKAHRSVIVTPAVRVAHANRGSVRGRKPWKLEYRRGWHHARSKVLFTAKHGQPGEARRLRRRALLAAMLGLPLRVLAFSPRHVARWLGRIGGLWSAGDLTKAAP